MKFLDKIARHQKTILIAAILLYIVIFSGICLWKYSIFGYNGLDLAIFNQVFWNTSEGRWFEFTIHPHSYLGDHAGFGILLLLPFYFLRRGPESLLILQTIALAGAAWPLYQLSRQALSSRIANKPSWALAPLVISLVWLLHPAVQNANMFEFHLLPFTLIPLFYMLLAYEQKHRGRFILFATLAMLFREDVSLVVAAVGILAFIEKRSYWWRIMPILFGATWFIGAMSVISHFSPGGGYKFSIYYSWLISSPQKIVPHIFSITNLEMVIGLGMPLLFLFLVSPKRLVLLAGPLLQILLNASGGGAYIIQTHYSSLFLPGIFLAAIAGVEYVNEKSSPKEKRVLRSILFSPAILGITLFAAAFSAFSLGPIPNATSRMITEEDFENASQAKQIISMIDEIDDASIVASYSLITHLSSRQHLYSASYAMIGVQQFNTGPYVIPTDRPILLAIDKKDLEIYHAQFSNCRWGKSDRESGYRRLNALAGPPLLEVGDYILFGPREPNSGYQAEIFSDEARAAAELRPDGINILDPIATQKVIYE